MPRSNKLCTLPQYHFPWETLSGLLEGKSVIDSLEMPGYDPGEIKHFILNYGYDLDDPRDKAEADRIQAEAIEFINTTLLDEALKGDDLGDAYLHLKVPASHVHASIIELFLMASQGATLDQRWACALLKVMHIISHINNTVLYRYFEEAKHQILNRYQDLIVETQEGEIILGYDTPLQLSLAGFEVKDEKSRHSVILKLLCKRENITEEIYDMIGVRFVTQTPAEALIALEILRKNRVIVFPNSIPSRSRNSLIDFQMVKQTFEHYIEAHPATQITLKTLLETLKSLPQQEKLLVFNPENQNSHSQYQAIHITQRQLIRVQEASGETQRFFFPYEIQVVDEANYLKNLLGSSSHTQYKQSQLLQARRRVLGAVFLHLHQQKK
jgi:uncharacterized protein (TIGR04562 family)